MRKYIAEFVGTMMLVLFGCGSAVAANTLLSTSVTRVPLAFSTLLIAFAFGLIVVAMAYSVGNISGCHINPAVSVGMLVAGRMGFKDFIGYIIAQLLGGIAGAGLLSVIVGGTDSLGANGYGDLSAMGSNMGQALIIEFVLTFVFVFAVLGATDKLENKAVAGLVIGLTLTVVHIFGVPFTGTSVNPARSLGPAIFQGGAALEQVWVFIVAPIAGAIFAALLYTLLTEIKSGKKAEAVEISDESDEESDDESEAEDNDGADKLSYKPESDGGTK